MRKISLEDITSKKKENKEKKMILMAQNKVGMLAI